MIYVKKIYTSKRARIFNCLGTGNAYVYLLCIVVQCPKMVKHITNMCNYTVSEALLSLIL